jgi:hypothetical protein
VWLLLSVTGTASILTVAGAAVGGAAAVDVALVETTDGQYSAASLDVRFAAVAEGVAGVLLLLGPADSADVSM